MPRTRGSRSTRRCIERADASRATCTLRSRSRWARALPWAVVGALAAGLAAGARALGAVAPRRRRRASRARPLRTSGPAALTISGFGRDLALSPDGTHVVYVGNSGTQLFVRALDALEPVAIATGNS